MFGKLNIWAKKKHVAQWNLDRMTSHYKTSSMALVAFPKAIIPIALTIVGGNYIMRSEDAETMILNTLAVLFVIDIDEYFYGTFTSTNMKRQLCDCKPLVFDEVSNKARLFYWVESVFIFPLMVGGATLVMVYREHYVC